MHLKFHFPIKVISTDKTIVKIHSHMLNRHKSNAQNQKEEGYIIYLPGYMFVTTSSADVCKLNTICRVKQYFQFCET